MATQQHESGPDRPNSPHKQSPPPETGVTSDRLKRVGLLGIGAGLLLGGLRRLPIRGLVMTIVGAGVLIRTLFSDDGRDRTDAAGSLNRRGKADGTNPVVVRRSATIGKSPDELFDAWRDSDVFSRVMGNFAEVTPTDEDGHRWTIHGPAGVEITWETRIVDAEEGEVIRWETPSDAPLPHEGSVRFRPAPDGRGTRVVLSLTFEPPGGRLGAATLKRLDVVPETLAGHALGRFKSLVESGEIATLEGNPSGRGTGDLA